MHKVIKDKHYVQYLPPYPTPDPDMHQAVVDRFKANYPKGIPKKKAV